MLFQVGEFGQLISNDGIKATQHRVHKAAGNNEFSPILEEGRYSLIEEFGKEYGTYFAILELISFGKTARPEIEWACLSLEDAAKHLKL